MDNCSSADGTMSIQLVRLQWRMIAEHFQLIKISMLNIRCWCENQREGFLPGLIVYRNVPQCYAGKIDARRDGDGDCFFVATVASIDQTALHLLSVSVRKCGPDHMHALPANLAFVLACTPVFD